ncbi:MAG: hypothetical protein EA396_11165 [Anaerolineaceae bacterium]|nr:MAG: hypothetical protein EA396_11165 [Anaerolineaceae bacterium]
MTIILLLIALFALPLALAAQDDDAATDDAVAIDLEALAARVEAALSAVDDALEEIDDTKELTLELVGLTVEMFGLFEGLSAVFGIALPIIVAIAGFFGFRRLERSREELVEARERFETEMKDKGTALEELSAQMEGALALQRKSSTDASIALGLLAVGQSQYRGKDNDGAIRTFQQAIGYDTQNPIILYNLGYVQTQSSKFDDALESLHEATRLDENFLPAKAALGYVYRRIGDQKDTEVQRLIAEAGKDRMDDEVTRLIAERVRDYNTSERYFIEALNELPKLIDEDGESWWGALGGLYRRRSQLADAIDAYERAAEVTPKSSYPFSNLAMLQAEAGNIKEMLRRFERVEQLAYNEVQNDADNIWGYNDLVTARLALGKAEAAFEALEEVLQIASKDSPYALNSLRETLADRLLQYLPEERRPAIRQALERIAQFEAERAGDSDDVAG